ncbi:hypothetical protein Tco_1279800 [Tanacetum coccineum]
MEVIPNEEKVAVDIIPLATKPPSIVDWKIHKEGKKSYYQIIRADGGSKMYLVFSHMLKSFDREDLETLYKLVKAKYGSTRPVEDLDLVLYGDLKTMFDPHVEDQVWKNQSDYRVLEWKLYDYRVLGIDSYHESKCLPMIPLHGDSDLTIMKFIHTFVQCSASPVGNYRFDETKEQKNETRRT